MMNTENLRAAKKVLDTGKAIYLVSGLEDLVFYLDLQEELGRITEEQNDKFIDIITDGCASITVGEKEEFIRTLRKLGK